MKRYDIDQYGAEEDKKGKWVKYKDVQKLEHDKEQIILAFTHERETGKELEQELADVKELLSFTANALLNDKAITDTVWYSPGCTLFDAIQELKESGVNRG